MGKRSHDSMSASESRLSPELGFRSMHTDHHNGHISKSAVIENSMTAMMQCSLPPHSSALDFPTLEAFELHYAKEHTNRCTSCGKNFPSAHFLALHLDEAHNPVREVLAAKGEKTYGCFVEGCEKKCSAPSKRRLHLIDKHGFPKAYNFRIVEHGIDKTTSLLREGQKRRVSTTANPPSRHYRRVSNAYIAAHDEHGVQEAAACAGETTRQASPDPLQAELKIPRPDDQMNELETSLSALSFVPRSVQSRQVHTSS